MHDVSAIVVVHYLRNHVPDGPASGVEGVTHLGVLLPHAAVGSTTTGVVFDLDDEERRLE